MEETLDNLINYVSVYGLNILAALVIFVVGRWLARVISNLLEKVLKTRNVDSTLASFLKNLVYYVLFIFVLLAVLAKLGIQTTSFIAVLGAAGLAVGMALSGSLSNFASGVMIVLFKPFKLGHFIDAGGAKGVVQEIKIFSTVLSSPDNVRIIIPNSQILSGNIDNYSVNPTRRVDLVVGVSYEDDLQKVKTILQEVVSSDSRVLQDPALTVAVSELGDSSVNLVVRPWVNNGDYWPVYFDLTEKIKLELDKNGVSIPYPQRDLHIKTNVPAATS